MPAFPPMILVFLLWLAGLGAAAQFGKISVIYPALRAVYGGAGEASLGLIVSVVGFVGLIFGTTAGLLVAKLGPKRVIVAAMILGAFASLVEALMPAYPVMIALRLIEGASHLAIVVVGPTMIAGLAPERYRGFAMTLWSSFFAVAYAILALIAPAVLGWGGAAAMLIAHAIYMAVLAAILALALPQDPKVKAGGFGALIARHLAIYRSPTLAAPAMGFVFYTFLYVAMLTLLPPAAPLEWQKTMALVIPIAAIACSLTLGVWALNKVPAHILVQYGYLAAIPGFLFLAMAWGDGPLMLLGAIIMSAGLGVVQGASFAAIPQLNYDATARAEASGAVAQLGNLGTTTGTPILAALLVNFGPGALAGLAIFACTMGILIHQLQAKRRR